MGWVGCGEDEGTDGCYTLQLSDLRWTEKSVCFFHRRKCGIAQFRKRNILTWNFWNRLMCSKRKVHSFSWIM